MHPHLVEDKQKRCAELIKALEECHAKGFMHKFTGGCNGIKHRLNLCLREERLERTERNLADSARKREKKMAVWKEIDEDRART